MVILVPMRLRLSCVIDPGIGMPPVVGSQMGHRARNFCVALFLLDFPLVQLGDQSIDSMNQMQNKNVGCLDLLIPYDEHEGSSPLENQTFRMALCKSV